MMHSYKGAGLEAERETPADAPLPGVLRDGNVEFVVPSIGAYVIAIVPD
jgi:hypothetical protein